MTYPLLTWLDGLLAQLDPVAELTDRLTYTPPDAPDEGDPTDTADLVDPATADGGWLPWLAQLVGVGTMREGLTAAQRRTLVAGASDTWDHGTPGDLAEAAAAGTVSGDPADVEVTPHYGGDPFVIGIGTAEANVTTLETWADLKAAAPRWRDLMALGSFRNTRAPGPVRAVTAAGAKPAGYDLASYFTD